MKRRIGVDMDDVLVDFHTALVDWHNFTYGTSLKVENLKTYRFHLIWGGTGEEAIRKVDDFNHSNYFKQIVPIKDSIKSIEALSKENELFVITSRPTFLEEDTNQFVNKFFKDKFSDIFYASNHYSKAKNSGKTKLQLCEELGIFALIDDSSDYIQQCMSGGIEGILFGDYPWNQDREYLNLVRAKNWKEVLGKLL